jgi:hypothetical protein
VIEVNEMRIARFAQLTGLLEHALALAEDAHLAATSARIAHALDTLNEARGEIAAE